MRQIVKISFLLIILSWTVCTSAPLHRADIGDLRLDSGQTIQHCTIAYRVYGQADELKDNIVLFPTWFGGATQHIGSVIGPGKLVDTTRFQVIAVAALGNGESSSPSNYKGSFPRITIRDMVRSQYILLTRVLHITHLLAVVGGSMGGMQTFQWLVDHPRFMDKAVPYVGSPKLTSNDLLLINLQHQIIQMGLQHNCPEDSVSGLLSLITRLTAHSPSYNSRHISAEDIPAMLKAVNRPKQKLFTLQNYDIQLQAMLSQDISAGYNHNLQKAAEQIKAGVFIIVSKSDHIVDPMPALLFAEQIKARTYIIDDDCGHLAIGCHMAEVSTILNEFLTGSE